MLKWGHEKQLAYRTALVSMLANQHPLFQNHSEEEEIVNAQCICAIGCVCVYVCWKRHWSRKLQN